MVTMFKRSILATIIVATFIAVTITSSTFANAALPNGQPFQMLDQRLTALEQNNQRVNSFFDVFTERHFTPNSFFDIFTELQTQADSFFDIFTELRQADAQLQSNIDAITPTCSRLQHWDKIEFSIIPLPPGVALESSDSNQPPIVTSRLYDIKVLDDPLVVADLSQKVVDFLDSKGYSLKAGGVDVPISDQPELIVIVDIEYAIVCLP